MPEPEKPITEKKVETGQLSYKEVEKIIMESKGMDKKSVTEMVTDLMKSLDNFINEIGAIHLLASNLDVPLNEENNDKKEQIKTFFQQKGPRTLLAGEEFNEQKWNEFHELGIFKGTPTKKYLTTL